MWHSMDNTSNWANLIMVVFQEDPNIHLRVPTLDEIDYRLDVLYNDVTEEDHIHDVVFHVRPLTYIYI